MVWQRESILPFTSYLQHLIYSCQGSSARPGFGSNGNDAFHHSCVITIQACMKVPKECHLLLGEQRSDWTASIGNFDAAVPPAFHLDGIAQRQVVNVIADGSDAHAILCRQICSCASAATTKRVPDRHAPFIGTQVACSFLRF